MSYFAPPSPSPVSTSHSDSEQPQQSLLPVFSTTLGQDLLCVMKVFPGSPDYFATGGEERDLHIWKVEPIESIAAAVDEEEDADSNSEQPKRKQGQPIIHWKAKNVKNDFLDMRVPISIVDLQFVNPFGVAPTKIVTISRHKFFRVYDVNRDGRRPLLTVEHGEHPMKCLELVNDGK
jgi:ribosome biogenesis protein NSA1